ncbi:C80 family cysteine peptidase [Candidatus Regiella insecticola]|nr:C80 family cysteine peptidase [Candidatus Regiella insecticola]
MTREDTKQTIRYATNLLDDRVTSPPISQSNKLAVSGANYSANTRFDSQLILQLEDDLAVVIAAEKLTSKHPDRSVQFKFDSEGRLHLVYGNVLSGQLRWQVVGHGSGGENEINHQTLGGYSPTKLAEKIKQLSTILYSTYQVNSTPHYVSLVGCSLTDYDLQTGGYAYQFGIALDKQGIRADIAARRTQMAVNELGHKITLSDDGFLYHKISEDKLVLTWNIQGQLVSASDLTMRLVRAITLVDQLSSGEVKYSALDVQQRRDLADSFHRAEGILDVEKLILTAFEHRYYQAWRNDMHQLLQLQDSYAQLRGMTGQTARQYSNYWSACQSNSIVSWRRAGMENRTQGVEIDIRIAPQGLFIGDSSTYAFVTATGMGTGRYSTLYFLSSIRSIFKHFADEIFSYV